MSDSLGDVQETLFIPLAARARETRRRQAVLRDPKAVQILAAVDGSLVRKYRRGTGGSATVLRTAIMDEWVRSFTDASPGGTVIEIGTGLNTRFERTDNGKVNWIDLDLPDTLALRRSFFADAYTETGRRRMLAASVLDDGWLDQVASCPGPYFFVAEGVLVYLPLPEVRRALAGLARRFPDALVALDVYPDRSVRWQHKMAARRGIPALFAWSLDDPASLAPEHLTLVESAAVTRPQPSLRDRLPFRARVALKLLDPLYKNALTISLYRATPPH
jgi:O-methyltransferase involved in polyketide biosynthesis